MTKTHLGITLTLGMGLALTLFLIGGQAAPANPVVHPMANSHTAAPSTTVSIAYDEAINPASVSTETFAVYAMETGLLTATYAVDGGRVSLAPAKALKPGEVVQASATKGLLSLVDGQGPISPTVWSFRVATGVSQGIFVDSGQLLGESDGFSVALGDLDSDGDLDAFVGGYNPYIDRGRPNEVWLNNGGLQGGAPGSYRDSGQRLGESRSQSVALGDLDGDGDLDAFVANGGNGTGEANQVWLNDGTGVFSTGQSLSDFNSKEVALGDLDGDGDLDAFVANGGHGTEEPNSVWLNDGLSTFGLAHSLSDYLSQDVALADLDGDGDLDAWVANGSPANRVWLNDGSAAFVDSGQRPGSISQAVALGDVDGDGDVDAVVGAFTDHTNAIWLNDGLGVFVESDHNLGHSWMHDLALGDVDADGDLDAITATEAQPARVWKNDGAGAFAETGQSLASSSATAVELGDMDGDGDLDALFQHGGADKVWLNDGTGTFRAGERGMGCLDLWAAALGDLDGDGDLDAFGARGGPNRVCLNREVYRLYLPLSLKKPGQ